MKIRAQIGMVLNLDKCIGCHTCSVTCKNVWTNRRGTEYVWFNNVETKPGRGYPVDYEDQERWQGGWERTPRGRLKLKAGGRLSKLSKIFSNPKLPGISDYYEPWTYEYDLLLDAPAGSALQMLVRECPAGERCPLWVGYHAATEFTIDSWVRVLGVVEGQQQFRSETDEIKVVPKVEATFLLPAKP